MQKITVIGRLVRDAAVRDSQSGKRFASFTVAVNAKVRGADKTSYYDVLWNGYYEKMIPYLKKGSAVGVVGDLDAGTEVSTKDGRTYLRLNLFADSVQFINLGGNSNNNATNEASTQAPANTYHQVSEQAPAAPQMAYSTNATSPVAVATPQPQPVSVYSGAEAADDLPF